MYSFLFKQINQKYKKNTLVENYEKILIAMQPVVPHFSNECLETLKTKNVTWPKFDEKIILENTINIVVQVNGKKRGLIKTNLNSSEDDLMNLIKNDHKIMKYIEKNEIKKKIYIKNKLLNIII